MQSPQLVGQVAVGEGRQVAAEARLEPDRQMREQPCRRADEVIERDLVLA